MAKKLMFRRKMKGFKPTPKSPSARTQFRFQCDVTLEDIKKGKKGGIDNCPIARAIKRNLNLPEASAGFAVNGEMRFPTRGDNGKMKTIVCRAPESITKWFGRFDECKAEVLPFSFEVTGTVTETETTEERNATDGEEKATS